MSDERSTIRPVTLARLTELTYLCEGPGTTTAAVEDRLSISHRRARETILEATRIGLLSEENGDEAVYRTTEVGERFLEAIKGEEWATVSEILATRSPHYGAFLDVLRNVEPARLAQLLDELEDELRFKPHSFNQTGIEVIGSWSERLGAVQRNAFSGDYYVVSRDSLPPNFQYVLLENYDELEETAGVNLRQRYLSIPRLREYTCQRLRCTREAFDGGLAALCRENVGKLELSGAPLDTAAKDAVLGIKEISLSDDESLVSTSQSTQRAMAGVEQFDKQYYYLAVYDRDITYTTQ